MMNTPIGNRDLIRAINRSTVLNIIKTNGAISRTEIARISGLSAATVTGISADLIDEGLIFEKAEGNSSGGRRPILLAINPRGGYVVGIKLMEDHAIAAITDLEATIITKHSKEFRDKSLENALNMLVESVNDLVFEVGIDQEQIFGIGIGLAGIVDARNGILHYSPYVGWHNVPLGDLLRDRLGVPVRIDNDVNTLTLTEQLFGAGQGIDNFLLVTIGRGVGLGIVVNGQLYRGINGGGGEFGHTVIDPYGPECACGKRGCLETYVADPALVGQAILAASRGDLPAEIQSVEELVAIADQGNDVAREIFRQAGEILGNGIANLINVLSPQEIIISGEGVRAGELLFAPMRSAVEEHVMPGLAGDTTIRVDPWEDDAWARGAASLVLQELFQSPIEREKMSRSM